MRTLPALASLLVLLSCSAGPPPAFPKGDRWVFPLVGTLEGGQLIVPVYVQDAGPYLMVIDPDADATVIDEDIAKKLGVPTGRGGDILDEADTVRHRFAAEVKSLTIGNLTVGRQYYYLMRATGFQVAGREIHGVIGRDIISDVLAFGYDREQGVGYLITPSTFQPPAGATEISYSLYDAIDQGSAQTWTPGAAPAGGGGRGMGCDTRAGCTTLPDSAPNGDVSGQGHVSNGRRMVTAQIGGFAAKVHLDLGSPVSQLRRSLWAKAGLTEVAAAFDIRDEAGTIHHMTGGGIADAVTVGGVAARKTAFADYDDKRWDSDFIDGTIALDALRGHNAWANWNAKRFYLVPRGDFLTSTKARIGRWQSQVLDRCADGGCAHVRLLAPTAPAGAAPAGDAAAGALAGAPAAPPPSRVVVMIERDPSTAKTPLELVLAPVTKDGALAPAPLLIVNLAADANDASTQLPGEYAGLDLRVVDASPYPRACQGAGGCIDSIVP